MSSILNKLKIPGSNAKTPIVFILGWGGAQDNQLKRYSEIYESRGFDVTRYISPFNGISAANFSGYEKYAKELYNKALIDIKNDRSIIFHAFSMNGISVLIKIWDILSNMPDGDRMKKQIKGIVFDSGPTDTVAHNSGIAFSLAKFPLNSRFFTDIARFTMYLFVFAFVGTLRSIQWLKFITYCPRVFEREIVYYRLFEINDFPSNQLYLYSKIDPMIRYKDVERFIEHQKSLGANVVSKCWPDSSHVQHLKLHPKEYEKLCADFVAKLVPEIKIINKCHI